MMFLLGLGMFLFSVLILYLCRDEHEQGAYEGRTFCAIVMSIGIALMISGIMIFFKIM